MCYHVKVGIVLRRRELPKLGSAWAPPLAVGAWLIPRNKPLPTCIILPNLVVTSQTVRALLRRPA